jgi:hypothetical protein
MAEMSAEKYDVVLLVEQELSPADATQVRALHEELVAEGQQVTYRVLLPLDDAAARIETAMGSLSGGEMLASPAVTLSEIDLAQVREECRDRSAEALAHTLDRLRHAGATAEGRVITEHPIEALAAEVSAVDGREAIILTRPHVVAEFFHLDWTSQARRKLGVPVLHLLEHEVPEG